MAVKKMATKKLEWNKECGRRIKEIRRKKGMSQGQLCYAAKIPGIRLLSRIESGGRNPQEENLKAICSVLNTTPSYILYGEEDTEQVEAITEEKPQAEQESTDHINANAGKTELFPGNSVAERLKFLRKKEGLSQQALAELADFDVCDSMISYIEHGKSNISESQLLAFATLFSCRVENLATEQELEEIRKNDRDPRTILLRKAWETRRKKAKNAPADQTVTENAPKDPIVQSLADQGPEDTTDEPAKMNEQVKETDEAKTQVSGNALDFAAYVSRERKKREMTVEAMAERLGMTSEEYIKYEKGRKEFTISHLSVLGKILQISPYRMIQDSFTKSWHLYASDDLKDLYAAYGACAQNGIEHISEIAENGVLHVYGDLYEIKKIFTNLRIGGSLS